MSRTACVAVVKNEERFISEWIAYQIAIGFDAVILMDNLCMDGTRAKAAAFSKTHDVRIVASADTSESYQRSAYLLALQKFGAEFHWIAFFDIDEFLVLDEGVSLKTCLQHSADAPAIGVNWAFFGSSGHKNPPLGFVVDNYLHRAPASFGPNRHVKSIVQPKHVQDFINGHTFAFSKPYRDLGGTEIIWESPGLILESPSYRFGKLHHYFTRSWDDWVRKIQRGYPDLERKLNEFNAYDQNEIFDNSAARYAPAILGLLYQVEEHNHQVSHQAESKVSHAAETYIRPPLYPPSNQRVPMAAAHDPMRPDLGGNVLHGDINTYVPTLWRFLVERYGINSVLDVGCGEGHAVNFFHRLGVHAHGIEGLRHNLDHAVIPIAHHDLLTGPYIMPVDFVWSCEVAEHIAEEKVNYFLDTLANGRIVAMTHAIPGQPGHHHVNCQPSEYWTERMARRGYSVAIENQFFRELSQKEGYPTYFATSGLVFLRNPNNKK